MIRIDKNYVIDVDTSCYVVKKDTHKTNKEGKPVYQNIGYFGTLTSAVYALADHRRKVVLSGPKEITLAEAIKLCEAENEKIVKALQCVADVDVPTEIRTAVGDLE